MEYGKITIAFLRHGHYQQLENTPSASQPFALTEEGKRQAVYAGKTLESMAEEQGLMLWPEVFSSTLLRAWQTADLIKEQWSQPAQVTSDSRLNERSVGALANLPLEQIEQVLRDDPRVHTPPTNWKQNRQYRLPFEGAESLQAAGLRVAECLKTIVNRIDQTVDTPVLVVVVGHGAAFRHAAYELGLLTETQIAERSMFYGQPLYLNASFSDQAWQKIGGDWKYRTDHNPSEEDHGSPD